MSLRDAVASAFLHHVVFTGRARRSEFWWFQLFATVVTYTPWVVMVVVNHYLTGGVRPTPVSLVADVVVLGLWLAPTVIFLVLLLPNLALTWRRLHDTGRTGLWYLMAFVPFAGPLVLVALLLRDSQRGTNAYGPSPKYPDDVSTAGHGDAGHLIAAPG